jgi:CCR4-NOT transcription complex subunit 1
MEVFSKYFRRLVVGNAPQIFPGVNRQVENAGNYQLLVNEMRKVSHDLEQAGKIAESIDTADGDLFRDFDLLTFMDHFSLDALEKTILALAFKAGSRLDLKTKGKSFTLLSYAD